MNEKEKKIAHVDARIKMAKELMGFADQSQDGGEYFISVNGMRMWLSYFEVKSMLSIIETMNTQDKIMYQYEPASGMVID